MEHHVLQDKWVEGKRAPESALNQPQDYVTEITPLQPGTPDDRERPNRIVDPTIRLMRSPLNVAVCLRELGWQNIR
jgi:hypothetical protein